MGAKDDKSKEYLADNTRFADLCNYKLYDGEQVILPEDLQERDSTEVLSVLGLDGKEIQTQKWHDLLKSAIIKSTKDAFYVLLGVENQTEMHYAMQVRSMLYDAMNYGKQVNEAKRRHEKKKDAMSSDVKKQRLTNEMVSTINLFTGSDIRVNEEGEVTDVCLAIEEMKKEAADEAVAECSAKDLINAVDNVMEGIQVSLEDACGILKYSVEDYEKAKKLVESLVIV